MYEYKHTGIYTCDMSWVYQSGPGRVGHSSPGEFACESGFAIIPLMTTQVLPRGVWVLLTYNVQIEQIEHGERSNFTYVVKRINIPFTDHGLDSSNVHERSLTSIPCEDFAYSLSELKSTLSRFLFNTIIDLWRDICLDRSRLGTVQRQHAGGPA